MNTRQFYALLIIAILNLTYCKPGSEDINQSIEFENSIPSKYEGSYNLATKVFASSSIKLSKNAKFERIDIGCFGGTRVKGNYTVEQDSILTLYDSNVYPQKKDENMNEPQKFLIKNGSLIRLTKKSYLEWVYAKTER